MSVILNVHWFPRGRLFVTKAKRTLYHGIEEQVRSRIDDAITHYITLSRQGLIMQGDFKLIANTG